MHKYRLSREQRVSSYQENGTKKSVLLQQTAAMSDFNDVIVGSAGGRIGRETVLVQERGCWTYDQNTTTFGGTVISGGTHITGTNVLWREVYTADNIWIDGSEISQDTYISNSVAIRDLLVCGQCRIFGHALIDWHSMIVAVQGLMSNHQPLLRIYDRAKVSASRIVHQAQIYGDVVVQYASIEHCAEVFGFASVEGNEENDVWLCDCTKVYGRTQVRAGIGENTIPTIHYSSQVVEYTIVEGNCVLKHHVLVGGNAMVCGGSIPLDEHVVTQSKNRTTGMVIIENHAELTDHTAVEASDGDTIHVHGPKVANGEKRVT